MANAHIAALDESHVFCVSNQRYWFVGAAPSLDRIWRTVGRSIVYDNDGIGRVVDTRHRVEAFQGMLFPVPVGNDEGDVGSGKAHSD